MGRHRKIVEIELAKEEEIPEKSNVSQLSGKNYASFSGDTFGHAVKSVWEWVESVSSDKTKDYKIVVQDYYHQKAFGGRGIIVSYNRIPK